ncbi:MAG TPA: 23S ribosomal RNA methyltransferase Erm [Gallicola sp.]|nr:23S ribosomal RNA methyltransferase Erm [Gallicola sp.]
MQKNEYWITQNFMTKKSLIKKIINLSNIDREDKIIEIGTGKGHITEELAKKSKRVFSIEIDEKLYKYSKEKLNLYKNCTLINMDFLDYKLPKEGNYKVFSNIPYSITTKIINKLTNVNNKSSDIYLVMEKGAAKRFLGQAKETRKSLIIKPFWDMEILYFFRKDDFNPKPSVESVLVHFSRKNTSDICTEEKKKYEQFINHSFKYGLYGRRRLLTKRQIQTALKFEKLDQISGNNNVKYAQFLCLFKYYNKL